ncbi:MULTISPECIES: prepilin peptidase [Providencia]|uniref:prepilin peptidase n=1 Tax=Providencia TaxID=586 RepID=UPI001E4E76E5|nr:MULTISPECIES: A24 family peptidase [Providencia]MCG5280666.1 A24 family peptidase [Providencia rettgeri]MCX9109702.1 A24 family peptidase [Providencia rettgeri]MCX9117751.1 A24 family peptidase [Providencia rettgeri]MDH2365907.1 A24 family peptidase [Providencia rettgeri]
MRELLCTLISSVISIISPSEQFTLSCQNDKSINIIDFICVFSSFFMLLISFFTTKKLLIYLPVVHFDKSKIIIKNTVLLLIYSVLIFIIYYSSNNLRIILFLTLYINLIIPLFIIDNKIGYLPDVLTYPLLWVGLLYQIHLPNGNVVSAIYAVLISYLVMLMVVTLVEKQTYQPQMGRGDFKLVAACSAWLGVWELPYFLGTAAGLGLLQYWVNFGLWPKIYQKKQLVNLAHAEILSEVQIAKTTKTIPFGPALIISASTWLYLSIIEY